MIQISLETLKTGKLRATGHIEYRTVQFFEGEQNEAKHLVNLALKAAAGGHEIANGKFDMTYIELNEAAKIALA